MLSKFLQKTEEQLVKNCDLYFYEDSIVNKAARYSLLNAGKRVRAMFIYLTAQMCGMEWEKYADLACGVEMIHCYSLIHDDLPCMDDDDMRRGKLFCFFLAEQTGGAVVYRFVDVNFHISFLFLYVPNIISIIS